MHKKGRTMLNQNVTGQSGNRIRIISTSLIWTGLTEKQRRQIEQIKLFCQDTLACLSIFIATGAMLWILPLMQGASQ
jgi:hypothetical protein